MESEFFTASQLAATFGGHAETVKRMARNGELPAFKFGRRWFFPKSQLAQQLLARVSNKCHLRRDEEQ